MNVIKLNIFVKRLFKFIVLVFIIFSFFSPISLAVFDPPWEDNTQPFRIEFNISGATSSLDRYTMQIEIDSIFMSSNFDFSEHRDSIRLYYYNRTSEESISIPHYFIDYEVSLEEAQLQFKVPFISSSNGAELVLYFGNNEIDNVEDFCSTFIHCDLFDRTFIEDEYQIGDFDLVAGSSFSIVDERLQIRAGGADTWTGNDEYGSVFLQDIEGDVDVRVAIISQENPDPWNKAGIMIRNDISQPTISTGYIFQAVTSSNGYAFQRDSTGNGFLNQNTAVASRVLPSYLRVTKSGQTFTGFYSTTTPNSWTTINSATLTTANTIQDIGLSSTSHAGATLDTVLFDNFTIQRHTIDSIVVNSVSQSNLPNELLISIIQPSTISITNVEQNSIFTIESEISCFSYDSSTCGDVDIFLEFDDLTQVSTSSTTPLFTTSSNPQSCTLGAGNSCIRLFDVNLTGTVGEVYDIQIRTSSSVIEIEDSISDMIRSRVVLGTFVAFNQSILNLNQTTQFSGELNGSIEVSSNFGSNSNIEINCVSGDCSTITPDFSLILNLEEGTSQEVIFTCSDQYFGNFQAVFELSSDESSVVDILEVSCQVEQVFGPISISKLQPSGSGVTLLQNESVTIRYNVSCSGECGEVDIELLSPTGNWWNFNWGNRVEINITNSVFTPENFQILVEINNSILDDYQWSNNCSDLRFIDNFQRILSYWIEVCDTFEEEAFVWVRLEDSILADELYSIYMYYNNDEALSLSSPQDTFREDETHLVTGLWNDGQAPLTANHINNNNDANLLRSTIGINGWTIFGEGFVPFINHNFNIYGLGGPDDDFYYSRYRFLFIPSSSGSFTLRTNSDDGSEIGVWNFDGFGSGFRTPIDIVTSTQTRVAFWYGGHANQALCNTGGTDGTISLSSNEGIWIDYVMNERTGGQLAQMCINRGSGFQLVNNINFAGEIFARIYLEDDPQVTISLSQDSLVSTQIDDIPLWTSNNNPENCNISQLSWCIVEFEIFATGIVEEDYEVFIRVSSNFSQIDSVESQVFTITITQDPIPEIELLLPMNSSILLESVETEFRFFINGSSSQYFCNVYINSVLQEGSFCLNLENTSIFLNLSSGFYEYYIEVLDGDQNSTLTSSEIFEFRKVVSINKIIRKEVISQGEGIYGITIELVNNLVFNQGFRVFDLINEFFNSGSYSGFTFILEGVFGLFQGYLIISEIIEVESNSNETISYAVSSNNQSQSRVIDLFVVGFD